MKHRTFVDRTGTRWRVVEVPAKSASGPTERERRKEPRGARPRPGLLATRPHAWLCFASASERCKVSSVPNDWTELDDARLEDLLGRSEALSRQDSADYDALLRSAP